MSKILKINNFIIKNIINLDKLLTFYKINYKMNYKIS